MKLALVTCKILPEPDVDADLMLEAFSRGGFDVEFAAWDDPGVQWENFDVALIRSTWNYYEDVKAFRDWIVRASKLTKLINSPEILLQNLHKEYLLSLQERGVPIVPTRFVKTAEQFDMGKCEWDSVVIKPAVSAGSFLTQKFAASESSEAQEFLDTLVAERDAMIQPYMRSVSEGGEIAIVTIGGEITHGVVKSARFSGSEESVSHAVDPDSIQREVAEKVLGALELEPVYARVDLMLDNEGRWVLSELELIEPSLFFKQNPRALDRLVECTRAWEQV